MVILVGMYYRLPYHLLLSYRTPATSGTTANLFTEHALAKSCPLHEVAILSNNDACVCDTLSTRNVILLYFRFTVTSSFLLVIRLLNLHGDLVDLFLHGSLAETCPLWFIFSDFTDVVSTSF